MSRDDIIERIAGQLARTELTDEGQSLRSALMWARRASWPATLCCSDAAARMLAGKLGYVFNPALGGCGYATEAQLNGYMCQCTHTPSCKR